jgi:2-oxo-4-hydroxy-4-carboxy-5-ureidoimidazoline decarboxylase
MSEAGVKTGGLSWLNALPEAEALAELMRCCGSTAWAQAMANARPFPSEKAVHETADSLWETVSAADILEALSHHPQIGELSQLKENFASTRGWAEGEQAGVKQSSEAILEALHSGNIDYARKFGFIFVVFATGKTASQMLSILQERLPHEREEELKIARGEQRKITHNRLEKLWQQQQP